MTASPRNIILLSADALRADHLSCYGYHRETSPVLDELAEESSRFTNAYSVSSHTREAVPGLLTGEYPDVAVDKNYRLATETIASTLSAEGYATGGFHSNPFISRAYGFDKGFDEFDDDLHLGQHKLIALAQRALDKIRNRHYARAEEINERSLSWIDSLEDGQSFFLWNHYMDTHGPYEPPNEYATMWAEESMSGRGAQKLYQRAISDPESITDEERQLLIDLYDGEIRYNDEQIGEFLDALRERGLLEESLLVFTSDHGDAFGEHGYYEHPRYLHKEITHVPLLLCEPDGGRELVDNYVSTLDIHSTFISDSAGDGIDLRQVSEADNRFVFSQARGEDDDSAVRRYAVRGNESQCFAEFDTRSESLSIDECGSSDLTASLREHIENRKETDGAALNTDEDVSQKEVERRLEALGYK